MIMSPEQWEHAIPCCGHSVRGVVYSLQQVSCLWVALAVRIRDVPLITVCVHDAHMI
jgi:hypothetical protein